MSAGTLAVLALVLVILAAGASAGAGSFLRTRGLRRRFGPEYDRTVAEWPGRRQAENELTERERRVRKYQLRDVRGPARKLYEAQWADVQELFVESPAQAAADGQMLVEAVMRERGYPPAGFDQMVRDLSVEHARALDYFRAAHETSAKAAAGKASTEEIRVALLYYRELFSDLLGAPATKGSRVSVPGDDARDSVPRPAAAGAGQIRR
ncbi:MAG TPA: hypothetical protein VFQ44_29135 [Streptosporangiaceae bacterium]|nr:hypothetical protein [Streptosporangiaceae bacterium]